MVAEDIPEAVRDLLATATPDDVLRWVSALKESPNVVEVQHVRVVSKYCDECGSTRPKSERFPDTCQVCVGDVPDPRVDARPRFVSLKGVYDDKDVAVGSGQGGAYVEAFHARRRGE